MYLYAYNTYRHKAGLLAGGPLAKGRLAKGEGLAEACSFLGFSSQITVFVSSSIGTCGADMLKGVGKRG